MIEQMESYIAFVFVVSVIGILYFLMEDHRDRIRELSHTLQLIELHTGIPYYTSLRPSHLGIEDREWLIRAKQQRANSSVHQ
jgi:hypothetical protein